MEHLDNPYKGLANVSATCYINTIVSCLGNCKEFLEFVINKIDPSSNSLINELRLIYYDQWVEGHSLIPNRFLGCLVKNITELNIHSQNDINEFLSILIDKLNKCICEKVSITKETLIESNNYDNTPYDAQRLKMDINWYESNKNEYSNMLKLFYGQTISQIICGNCDHIHHNYELYMNIMVPITSQTQNLTDCIKEYFNEELLNKNESVWKCTKCDLHHESKKVLKIWNTPKILIISLKRFTYDEKGNSYKNNKNIDIPSTIDLSKHKLSKGGMIYNLRSVAMHIGDIDSGHYYSICKHKNGKHYIIDDLSVREVKDVDFSKNGYVFFYEEQEEEIA